MKKFFAGLLAAGPFALLAEEGTTGSNSAIVAVDDVTSIFTQAQTNMTSLIEAAVPVMVAFVVGGLVLWGVLALVGLLKRGFGAGKGR